MTEPFFEGDGSSSRSFGARAARLAALAPVPDAQQRRALEVDRRVWLKGLGAALIVPVVVGGAARQARAATAAEIGAYVVVQTDSSVSIYIGATEMGQGILTGLAQCVAEELMYDSTTWSTVKAVHSPVGAAAYYNRLFGIQGTGGSTSMMAWYLPLRQAGAVTRQMLIAAGAASLQSTPALCAAANGYVYVVANPTARVGFATIAAAAAKLNPANFDANQLVATTKLIGKSVARVDIPAKVHGTAIFGLDVRLPGMVFAAVQHCPTMGGTFTAIPGRPGGALAVVPLKNAAGAYNAIAAVATDSWSAMQAARSTNVSWIIPASSAQLDSTVISATAQTLLASGTPSIMEPVVGDPDTALAASTVKIDATYDLPYLAHATMEVMNCTVSITVVNGVTNCDIYAPTQGQSPVLWTAQAMLPKGAVVRVHTTFLGGGLGRKFEIDYVSQAIQTALAVGKPVKLMWSREQDFKNDKYRPCATIRVQAGFEPVSGGVSALIYRNVSPSIAEQHGGITTGLEDPGAVSGAIGLPYAMSNKRIEYVINPAAVPLGYWRSVGESYNTFAVESAIDELAHQAGVDPSLFRQRLLAASPGVKVLNAALALAAASPLPAGSTRGVAYLSGFGSLIALVVEISLDASSMIRVNKAFYAVDCGVVVNPGEVEAQMQSGLVHGLGATLWGQVTLTKGVVNVSNFNQYPVVKQGQMPTVKVTTIDTGAISGSALKVGGIGETGVPVVAPAIANAYFALTGKRQRTLPFYPGTTMGGL